MPTNHETATLQAAVLNFRDNIFPGDATTHTGRVRISRYTTDLAEALYRIQKMEKSA